MAAIQLDPKSKRYRIRFRFQGQEYKRSIKTKNEKEARSIQGRIEETIALIERGRMEVPDDVDPAAFIISDGKRSGAHRSTGPQSIGQLFDRYQESRSDGVKESTTLVTERIHLNHLRRLLRTSQKLTTVIPADLQQYVENRLKESHRSRSISPDIVADPQHREEFNQEEIEGLAASLNADGLIQPIVVRWDQSRSNYVIIAGERRYRAARLCGWDRITCDVKPDDISEGEIAELQLAENHARKDLNPIELARAFQDVIDKNG